MDDVSPSNRGDAFSSRDARQQAREFRPRHGSIRSWYVAQIHRSSNQFPDFGLELAVSEDDVTMVEYKLTRKIDHQFSEPLP